MIRKLIRQLVLLIGILSFAVLAYALVQTAIIDREYKEGDQTYSVAESLFISPVTNESVSEGVDTAITPKPSEIESSQASEHIAEITPPFVVDFETLQEINPDVVGWIYCADTQINYPILRGETNSTYLKRMYDGAYNDAGSIFMDYRHASDFSDRNIVIYGHNMKNGSMFHSINDFVSQDYFDRHTEWYILTPNKTYKIEIFASLITSYADNLKLYQAISYETEQWYGKLEDIYKFAKAKNEGVAISEEDNLVLLSTCNYSFSNARCVLLGKLLDSEPSD